MQITLTGTLSADHGSKCRMSFRRRRSRFAKTPGRGGRGELIRRKPAWRGRLRLTSSFFLTLFAPEVRLS